MPPLVTVTPDSVTLNPGESAQVTVQVDPLSDSGSSSVQVGVTVPPQYDYLISGDFTGTIGPGETAHIVGDVNQTGDVYVEGLLTGIDTFHWQGNGFTVFFQNGGQADLHGRFKAPWGEWGTDTTGWVAGDRLAVAPTAAGKYVPSELVWSDWSMPRPVDSPDVTLVDGSVRKPEVVNLSQSIVVENLARGFHIHDSGGIQLLSDVKFLNCGTTGVLGNYPHHFHMVGENARGSLLERVVVEGGKNHAFVPHASHGVTYNDCAAYNTVDDPYWWDRPPIGKDSDPVNDSNDTVWRDCLALWVKPVPGDAGNRLTAFMLGQGTGNECVGSAAACVQGKNSAAGFQWPERGEGVWEFDNCLAHNNKEMGIFVWQNGVRLHLLKNFKAYRLGGNGIHHGAYRNTYHYLNVVITETVVEAMRVNALASPNPGNELIFDNVASDRPLLIGGHNQSSPNPVQYRNCTFPSVVVREHPADGLGGYQRFEDCGLTPAVFDFGLNDANVKPDSIFELVEAGVVVHRWAAGVWS